MAEIRNLTRNGETFYPLTHVDAIVSNTGSGIDNIPIAGSNNLVKSDGLAQLFNSVFKENTAIQCQTIGEAPVIIAANNYYSLRIPVYKGEILNVVGVGGNATRLWATLDINGEVVRNREPGGNINSNPETITIQDGEVEFVYNTNTLSTGDPELNKSFIRFDKISETINIRSRIFSKKLDKKLDKRNFTFGDFITGAVNTAGSYGVLSTANTWKCLVIKVKKGDKFVVNTVSMNNNVLPWCILDANLFILEKSTLTSEPFENSNVIIQDDRAVYFAINFDFINYQSRTDEVKIDYLGNIPQFGVDAPLNQHTLLVKNSGIRFDNWNNTRAYNCGDDQLKVKVVPVASDSGFVSMAFRVATGDNLLAYTSGWNPQRLPTFVTTDEDLNVIRVINKRKTECYITVNDDEKWCFINDYTQNYLEDEIKGYVYYWPIGMSGFGRCLDYEPVPFSPTWDINDAVITNLKYLYGVRTGEITREYALRLYVEGLLRNGMPVTFANGLTTCIQSYDTNDSQRQVGVNLPLSVLDKIRNKTIQYIETYVGNLQNKQIRVLTIGDSYLDANVNNLHGQSSGPWNFASWLKWFSMMDNVRLGNINVNMLGTRNNKNKTISYKGNTYTIRACSEGVGGRTAYCYLNSPIAFKMGTAYETTVRLNSETAWYAFGLATQTPFDSSIPGRAFTEFSNTEENRMLLASTPFGRFKPDYGTNETEYAVVAVLWNKLKEFPDFSGTGDYTGNSSQKETMTSWFDAKMEEPDNPFYSKDKARAYSDSHTWTNLSAFDMDLYLSRYRTMNDSGERLAESDPNLGSLIKSTTRTQYDVCTPTHIIIELGTNDVNASLAIAKYGIDLLISEIQNWSDSVKVIWCIARNPGVWWNRYQNLFANIVGLTDFATKFDLNEYYAEMYGETFDKNSQIHFCPTYNVQSVLGSPNCIENVDLETEEPVIGNGSDTIHCSIVAHKTIGYQLYSLLTALL